MATLSFEEFVKKSGGNKKDVLVVSDAKKEIEEETKSPRYFQRVGESLKQSAEDIVSAVERPSESAQAGASPLEVGKQVAEAGLRTAGEFAGAIFTPITELLAPVVSPLIKKATNTEVGQDVVKVISDWASRNPEAAKDLEAIVNIGTATAGAKGIDLFTKGAVSTTKTATPTVKSVVSKTGSALKTVGEKTTGLSVAMEEPTRIAVQSYQASKPTLFSRVKGMVTKTLPKESTLEAPITEAGTAVRLLKPGTEWRLGVESKRISQDLWKGTIEPALKSTTKKVDMKEFFTTLEKNIIKQNTDLTRRKTLLNALSSLKEDFAKVGKVGFEKLQGYKEDWAKFVPEKAYKGQPIAGALNEIRNEAAQQARKMIYEELGSDVRRAYLDYGNLKSIAEAGIKSIDPLRSKGITRQAWEAIMDKAVTPVTTSLGKVLYKTGEGLEFIGGKGAKNVRDIVTKSVVKKK